MDACETWGVTGFAQEAQIRQDIRKTNGSFKVDVIK
jgi:hypothetical protein